MGIGKKAKSFDQIDFDREDFGMNDDEENEEEEGEGYDNDLEADEKAFIEKELKEVEKAKKAANNDLFGQGSDNDEGKEDPTAGKSSFEIRQMKVSLFLKKFKEGLLSRLCFKSSFFNRLENYGFEKRRIIRLDSRSIDIKNRVTGFGKCYQL